MENLFKVLPKQLKVSINLKFQMFRIFMTNNTTQTLLVSLLLEILMKKKLFQNCHF